MKYNVHISLKPTPLQLKIEGVKRCVDPLIAHLKKLTEVSARSIFSLASRKSHFDQDMVEDTFELPTLTPIRSDLIQRLSRLTCAFIQNTGEGGRVLVIYFLSVACLLIQFRSGYVLQATRSLRMRNGLSPAQRAR